MAMLSPNTFGCFLAEQRKRRRRRRRKRRRRKRRRRRRRRGRRKEKVLGGNFLRPISEAIWSRAE